MRSKRWLSGMRGAKAVAAFLIVAVSFLAVGKPVAAKGPAALTVEGPGLAEPLAIDTGAQWAVLTKLMEQTGLWYATGDLPRAIEAPGGELGAGYTLTWVNSGPPHLPVAERTMVQVVYLQAEDGPVIHTPAQESLERWGAGVVGWFAAPDTLPETLRALGVPVRQATTAGMLATVLPGGVGAAVLAAAVALAAAIVVVRRQTTGGLRGGSQPARS